MSKVPVDNIMMVVEICMFYYLFLHLCPQNFVWNMYYVCILGVGNGKSACRQFAVYRLHLDVTVTNTVECCLLLDLI
jgi:hypothetical protein